MRGFVESYLEGWDAESRERIEGYDNRASAEDDASVLGDEVEVDFLDERRFLAERLGIRTDEYSERREYPDSLAVETGGTTVEFASTPKRAVITGEGMSYGELVQLDYPMDILFQTDTPDEVEVHRDPSETGLETRDRAAGRVADKTRLEGCEGTRAYQLAVIQDDSGRYRLHVSPSETELELTGYDEGVVHLLDELHPHIDI